MGIQACENLKYGLIFNSIKHFTYERKLGDCIFLFVGKPREPLSYIRRFDISCQRILILHIPENGADALLAVYNFSNDAPSRGVLHYPKIDRGNREAQEQRIDQIRLRGATPHTAALEFRRNN